ncbi:MAG: NAD(P)/FAD-dependent oxidoreductase, partial [Candidatus Binatia bacterium]
MRVGIIGAGAAGLAAAYDLSRASCEVTVYEGAPNVGGLAAGFRAPHWEWTLEKFYHHWFASDSAILGLIRELGWSDQVLFPRPITALYHDGEFHAFDSPIAVLRFPGIPLVDRLRFGLVALYLRLTPRWQPLEKVTADSWLRKWLGPRAYNTLWKPMLVGKFGVENLTVVNMAWFWARIHVRTPRLGTFTGGFQAFMDKLAEAVTAQGTEIRLGCSVSSIERLADGTLQIEAGGKAAAFDAVISTCSPALMARLAPALPPEYSEKLRRLKSMGAVVLVIALDRQLTNGIYWHNLPKDAGFPFLAMVEHTNYISPEHYGGDHIIYCGDYLLPTHEYFQLSKEELLERFLPALKRFNPRFDRSWVKESWLWKTPYAQPVPAVNHSKNIPAIRTPVKGLYLASMSQVYPWDRGTNFAVEIGRRVGQMVLADFPDRRAASSRRAA